jgi:cytochrome c peroxidase/FtsP/CotA-like multicopper oxidase with cupredoxin domain
MEISRRKARSGKILVSSILLSVTFLYIANADVIDNFFLADGVTLVSDEPAMIPEHANYGAFEGGLTGTKTDTRIDLAVPEEIQRGGGGYNIPTGAPPSPLFGAQPFTQKMIRFEEFGPEIMPAEADIIQQGSFPLPVSAQSGPVGVALDNFLAQDIFPYPVISASQNPTEAYELNPWKADIEAFLGRGLSAPPAEGRPPGQWWAHQRYTEFPPKVYFQTAQAGARVNGGARDNKQRHQYTLGEFGKGVDGISGTADDGLYHNTVGVMGFEGTAAGIPIKFHPVMPQQEENTIFTFDGTLPPKLLSVRYGEGMLMRHYNALPIDPSANNGFGLHTITTHEHNGHNPAESDGYTNAFYFPGQFWDYRWPIQLAGYDSINTDASDPRAAYPCTIGETLTISRGTPTEEARSCQPPPDCPACTYGTIQIRGDWRETMSTHWFHDHMLDFTAQNVYKGNAAMMNYYSAIDRGNEAIDDGVNLRLPSGSSLDWGNRDYDVNLLIAGKAWDVTGQLFFNIFNTDGFLGDRMLTNWLFKPTMDVRARRYRFRLLNGSVSRYIKVAAVTDTGEPVPFHMIANDGNIMEHSVLFPSGELPTQAIAERYDIIIDFSRYAPGTKIYLVNLMEHKNGRGPEKDAIPIADVLSGAYNPVIEDGEWKGGDPVVGKFLQFEVVAYDGIDQSMDPANYVVGGQKMIPLPGFTEEELANATHRSYHFGRANGTDELPWTIKTDGGTGYTMDPRRLSAAPQVDGGAEIWHLSTGGGWSHPIHIHFEEGQVLNRDGMMPPEWETFARKDVFRIGPEVNSSRKIDVALRFREFAGTYVEHCHNTQHEDTAMLMRWDIEKPGQTLLLPTPMPTWEGVSYVDSHALATFRTGDLDAAADGVVLPDMPANGGDVNQDGVIDRIFDDNELRASAPAALEPALVPDMQHILDEYITDPEMAVALGKAFFWDQMIGSDGQACASCHFDAGADSRSKNQLSPGLLNQMAGIDPKAFDQTNSGGGGVNYQLVLGDYPFPKTGLNGLLFDDVTSSQGTIDAQFKTNKSGLGGDLISDSNQTGFDLCTALPSDFSLGGLNHRKVAARNAPTVVNAVFNHRNFWDGRANYQFNGKDPFGQRSNLANPEQGIWIYDNLNSKKNELRKQQILIKNASLASQAVGPALSTFEMSCAGKTFPLLGRKILLNKPLFNQQVAVNDSVLGELRDKKGQGLKMPYITMIKQAFNSKYWAAPDRMTVEGEFTQAQANFALFWGLAIQMYEATLISDNAPFDQFARGDNAALTAQQKLGLELFVREDRGNCMSCHADSEFTSASVRARAPAPDGGLIDPQLEVMVEEGPMERMRMADGKRAVYDGGYYNIGVTATEMDKCVGSESLGFPLSFSRQATTGNRVDSGASQDAAGDDNDFAVTGGPVLLGERTGVDGACKTPTIRNVELTAPYFHNGSHATLEQVVSSYMGKFSQLYANDNIDNLAPAIKGIDIQGLFSDGVSTRGGELDALVAFMKALTDERVRLHQAPFDHPELRVPNGSTGLDANSNGVADDEFIVIPAVGADGLAAPLAKFLNQ